MSTTPRILGTAGAFSLGGSFLFCAALAGALVATGHARAAIGAGIGLALCVSNLVLLYVTLRSLVGREAPGRAGLLAAVSSVGRLLLLGLALGAVAAFLGREAFLGAAGGLVLAQISLFLRRSGAKGGA
jgi:hypothetical protein